jgi:hypothetical protein
VIADWSSNSGYSVCFYLCNFNYRLVSLFTFLAFSVCKGSLGLSILVSMTRSGFNGYFQSYGLGLFVFNLFYPFVSFSGFGG